MKILYIEKWSDATAAFTRELHAGTGAHIEHADTIDAGLRRIENGHGNIDLILYTVRSPSDDILRLPLEARSLSAAALFRAPRFVLLAPVPLPLPSAAHCVDRQIVYLLREYPNQIIETVRVLLWTMRRTKTGPTIRIVFHDGHYQFFLCGPTSSKEIVVTAQIGKLLLLLLGGSRTVELIADTLQIGRNSVKQYMLVLGRIITPVLEEMSLAEHATDIVWMTKQNGGTLCGIRANVVWS